MHDFFRFSSGFRGRGSLPLVALIFAPQAEILKTITKTGFYFFKVGDPPEPPSKGSALWNPAGENPWTPQGTLSCRAKQAFLHW